MNSVEIDRENSDEFKDLLQRHKSIEKKNPVRKNYQRCEPLRSSQAGWERKFQGELTRWVTLHNTPGSGWALEHITQGLRLGLGLNLVGPTQGTSGLGVYRELVKVMRYMISDCEICDFGYELSGNGYKQSGVKGCLVMLYVLVVMRYVGNCYEQSGVKGCLVMLYVLVVKRYVVVMKYVMLVIRYVTSNYEIFDVGYEICDVGYDSKRLVMRCGERTAWVITIIIIIMKGLAHMMIHSWLAVAALVTWSPSSGEGLGGAYL
ncbi:hypothetical protein TEA_012041 [Camellia sinensis var. sinensis]|uniref:Uncharacterized protein n=1 Tax=Camellia sinensis var. sinensis TaxID=542762 RepID=A0A4S4EGE2_CAMSN|nr:hypothetical protein TEA_012041 [Camellia sinensis var. sinensis]